MWWQTACTFDGGVSPPNSEEAAPSDRASSATDELDAYVLERMRAVLESFVAPNLHSFVASEFDSNVHLRTEHEARSHNYTGHNSIGHNYIAPSTRPAAISTQAITT